MKGSLIAPVAQALVEVAAGRGVPRAALLETLGLTDEDLPNPEKRVAVERMLAAWTLAMRSLRDPALPIAVGKLASVSRFGLLGYALYTSPTVREAILCATRYHDLINDSGKWEVLFDEKGALVSWMREGPDSIGHRVANEQVITSFVVILRQAAGDDVPVGEICLRSPRPSTTAGHDQLFRAPVRWGASTWSIRLPVEVVEAKTKGAEPVLTRYFAEQTRATLELVTVTSWPNTVAAAIADRLPSGIPTSVEIARSLGVSERTARRRLAEDGESFAEIVARVQRERATALLDSGVSVREVAFATGFSDASAFSRAYRRWTGKPPSARSAS